MNESNRTLFNKPCEILKALVISILVVFFLPQAAMGELSVMERIEIQDNPLSVKFFVSQSIPVKVIQIEKKELLVALKNVKLKKGFKINKEKASVIQQVALESLQGNVIAVVLTSSLPYGYIQSGFNPSDSSFIIHLEKTKKATKPKITAKRSMKKATKKEKLKEPEKEKKVFTKPESVSEKSAPPEEKKNEKTQISASPGPPPEPSESKSETAVKKPDRISTPVAPAVSKAQPAPPVFSPPIREKSRYKGDISDIIHVIDSAVCDSKQISKSLLLLEKNLAREAFEILDQTITQKKITCPEQVYFLRAYAFFISVEKDDFARLLKAERLFQDALVTYPSSSYLPYGYSGIGIIQKKMNNLSAAEGYFNIVKQGYPGYSGLAEVLYHLADIYDKKGYLDKASRYYKQVFEDTVENNYIPDAGIGYGKSLFKRGRYLDSLAVLNYVVQSNPKTVYASHELLLSIGNANYEVGHNKEARQTLTRVLNLFPEIEGRDIILSKIGDTYGMEDNREKAIKIYELVREKFPDSDGFIASSMGIARYLPEDKGKIEIYEMIKNKFPENKFARIAMMRIAEIYQANGEYDRCIKEIENLLSTHPRGLRYEAVKLMQKAYEALFEKQLKSDEFTKVLNRYEIEHERIDRMESRKIALSVGLAYLQAKLYEESFNHLINAYKQYKRSQRSEPLLFGLGIAMDESGRKDDALNLFDAFSKRFVKSQHRAETLIRAGNIYLEKKKYKLSSAKFDEAYKTSKNHLDKGKILMMHSNVYEKKGDMAAASNLRKKAVKDLALASGENYEVLAGAYKELGRTYLSQKQYINSADAYLKALGFSKNDQEKANLGFLLGDAYQKGNIIPKAREAFLQVATSYDSVWARLARQRLNTMELAEMVQNS